NYLSNYLTENARWVDITFYFNNYARKDEAFNFISNLKDKILIMLEMLQPHIYETINHLVSFELFKFKEENGIVLRIHSKQESQKFIDEALGPILNILNSLKGKQEVFVDWRSSMSFAEMFKTKSSVLDAIRKFSFEAKTSIHRKILENLGIEVPYEFRSLVQCFLLAPNSVEFKSQIDIDKFLDAIRFPMSMRKTIVDRASTV